MKTEKFGSWLDPGDEIRLAAEHIGELCQRVVAGPQVSPLSNGY